jgi:hypothetical protein
MLGSRGRVHADSTSMDDRRLDMSDHVRVEHLFSSATIADFPVDVDG